MNRVLTLSIQILSISCDNAAPNDTMIEELADLVESFPGAANRTRCFTHILNLVAKTMIRQFDIPKGKAEAALSAAEQELRDLAEGIDLEELSMKTGDDGEEDDEIDEENEEGWIDECTAMNAVDREALEESTRPVKLVLVKVRQFFSKSSLAL